MTSGDVDGLAAWTDGEGGGGSASDRGRLSEGGGGSASDPGRLIVAPSVVAACDDARGGGGGGIASLSAMSCVVDGLRGGGAGAPGLFVKNEGPGGTGGTKIVGTDGPSISVHAHSLF